jgi:hypothetical protein
MRKFSFRQSLMQIVADGGPDALRDSPRTASELQPTYERSARAADRNHVTFLSLITGKQKVDGFLNFTIPLKSAALQFLFALAGAFWLHPDQQ